MDNRFGFVRRKIKQRLMNCSKMNLAKITAYIIALYLLNEVIDTTYLLYFESKTKTLATFCTYL